MKWTEADLDLVRTLWVEGATAAAIAERIGCTRNAVIGKVNKLALTRTVGAKPKGGRPKAKEKAPPRKRPKRAPKPAMARPEPALKPIVATSMLAVNRKAIGSTGHPHVAVSVAKVEIEPSLAPGSPPVIAAEIVRWAVPVDAPAEPAAPAEPKSFADLGARECKGFTAETKMARPAATLFCAAPVAPGSVYCPACKARFFVAFRPDMPSEFGRSRFSHSWKRAA